MDWTDIGEYKLTELGSYNIIVGKNGCGKSRLLKTIEGALRGRADEIGAVRYISPERAGLLQYDANVEQNLITNLGWLGDSRRQNQAQQFRQQSAAQFKRLELLVLREIEQDPAVRSDPTKRFDTVIDRINGLLDRVYLERGDQAFQIRDRQTKQPVQAGEISSGESELISLGIECLVFARECVAGKDNVLLLDEPDVHLHPDLQARFGAFLRDVLAEAPMTVLLATHSTAFLGAAGEHAGARLAFMRHGDHALTFSEIGYVCKRILPVFGAHPLSNVFNEAPVLLVEGEDDERIWQQAVRSSNGKVAVYPVAVDGVSELNHFEEEVAAIIEAVYDDAVGYSLRDSDGTAGPLGDVGPVRRFRVECRAAENLLLTDDVLAIAGTDWDTLEARIVQWAEVNLTHPHVPQFVAFIESGFDRKGADLKDIRNDLVGLMGSNKPWEALVGQAIAACASGEGSSRENSVRAYLGEQAFVALVAAPDASPLQNAQTPDRGTP